MKIKKVFISADIEGIYGAKTWKDVKINSANENYLKVREELVKQLILICKHLHGLGVERIVIKDGHSVANNIKQSEFPEYVEVINKCGGHYLSMMYGIDKDFDYTIFVGYHAAAGTKKNKLAHTLDSSRYEWIKINDEIASEFLININTSIFYKVPVLLLTGDADICEEANKRNVASVITNKDNIDITFEIIKNQINRLIDNNTKNQNEFTLPKSFKLEIRYKNILKAVKVRMKNRNVKMTGLKNISFKTTEWIEILKVLKKI